MTEPPITFDGTDLPDDADDPARALVPIRDPSTPPSKRTLDHAKTLLEAGVELVIVHVNLYHVRDSTRWTDLKRSISPHLGNHDANYVVRRGSSVEEVILEEAVANDVDIIVVGKNDQPRWLQTINRALGTKRDVATSLHDRASCTVEVIG